jgi:hypothetical protein
VFNQPLCDRSAIALDREKQRRRAGKVARIDWRAARQQEIDHRQMAKPSGMAQWPRAEAVARIDRSAVVQQFGHQFEAIFVGG